MDLVMSRSVTGNISLKHFYRLLICRQDIPQPFGLHSLGFFVIWCLSMKESTLSRRSFVAALGAIPLASAVAKGSAVPIGLELYSVRGELKTDQSTTLQAVSKLG